VEDNFLTALQVGEMVRDCGYRVAGTVARLKRGLDLIAERAFDGAIVDIDLDGTYSFPLCTELDRRKVPLCFLTAYSSNIIPSEFRDIPLLTKPADREQLRSALTALLPERPLELEPQPQPSPVPARGNQLLGALDEASWAALAPCLEWTVLAAGDYLEKRGTRPSHLTFPVAGAVSLEADAGKRRIQVALVGREAMVGTSLLLDDVAVHDAVVQFSGAAWRAPADLLITRLAQDRNLHRRLLRGVSGLVAQLSLNALIGSQATIERRRACWLLAAAERLDTDSIGITHEMLGRGMGVRRAGVTVALQLLEGKGALRSERRRVRIVNRDQLSAIARGDPEPQP
jgi:CRP-like cAMP-binding protein